AVAGAQATVVAQQHDPVTGLVGAILDQERRAGEPSGCVAVVAGPPVEVIDLGAARGEHERVVAGEGGGPPVGAHRVAGVARGGAGGDAIVGSVDGDGTLDVTLAKLP